VMTMITVAIATETGHGTWTAWPRRRVARPSRVPEPQAPSPEAVYVNGVEFAP
jgi:hypothetical protein